MNVSVTDLIAYMDVGLPFCLWNQSTKCPPHRYIFICINHTNPQSSAK